MSLCYCSYHYIMFKHLDSAHTWDFNAAAHINTRKNLTDGKSTWDYKYIVNILQLKNKLSTCKTVQYSDKYKLCSFSLPKDTILCEKLNFKDNSPKCVWL